MLCDKCLSFSFALETDRQTDSEASRVARAVECLPSKYKDEVQSLVLPKKKKKTVDREGRQKNVIHETA
jgi:hypothetical protein